MMKSGMFGVLKETLKPLAFKRQPMDKVIFEGKFLQLLQRDRWEFVERKQTNGVVVIAAKTDDQRWIVIEQRREPVGQICIELPAGLSGDSTEFAGEELIVAARRELLEETGYTASQLIHLGRSAPTPGLTSEIMDYFLATDVKQIEQGGGVGEENIRTHLVPDSEIDAWLHEQSQTHLISSMVYCGLYLARNRKLT